MSADNPYSWIGFYHPDHARRQGWAIPPDLEERLATIRRAMRRRDPNIRALKVPGFTEEIIQAALSCAARGWRVFPCHAATTYPNDTRCKHPRLIGWREKATTHPATIRSWWLDDPYANLGIFTGSASGITVVDLDAKPDKNGVAVLAELVAQHGSPLPPGPIAGRGDGRHIFFSYVPGLKSKAGVLPGIDTRSDDGLVIAAPSLHPSGDRYRWVEGFDLAPPPMPEWLRTVLMVGAGGRERASTKRSLSRRPTFDPDALPTAGTEEIGETLSDRFERVRARLTIVAALKSFDLPPPTCACPIHHGADDPTAFKSYAGGQRWHCHTRCEDGENDGDVADLVMRLMRKHGVDATLVKALELCERLVNGAGVPIQTVGPDECDEDESIESHDWPAPTCLEDIQ